MDLNLELDSLKKSMHKRLRKEKKSGLKMRYLILQQTEIRHICLMF